MQGFRLAGLGICVGEYPGTLAGLDDLPRSLAQRKYSRMLNEMVTTWSRRPKQCRKDIEAVWCVIIGEFLIDEGG